MQKFFSTIDDLNRFTFSLNALAAHDLCQHCHQSGQWVSHGYVYKQISLTERKVVGKRILCSRRYGKQGCGRSLQLYQQHTVPYRHYPLKTFITFILLLVKGVCVTQAYRQATQKPLSETRQAWRWLSALTQQMGLWRSRFLQRPDIESTDPIGRSRRLLLLCHTLQHVIPDQRTGMSFQHRFQHTLI